jgi:spore germination cell wall hydrolase CwlJ-like protein
LALAACGAMSAERGRDRVQQVIDDAGRLTPAGLARIERGMGEGALRLAARFDPAAHTDLWGRAAGWTSLDLAKPPVLSFGQLSSADAAQLNAMLPVDETDFAPAEPFVLKASGPERDRAVLCLTQAVYYEAALEPLEGQQAVAQTVLNRVRHPDFPKSVCGVVYQGSELPISCQFSFTCDGSLARPPIEPYWSRAKDVALAALAGFVAQDVGSATHYHADYVFPRWGPQMVKIVQLGAHIFYRFPGPAGAPQVLTGRYAGGELLVSMTGPSPEAIAAAKLAGEVQIVSADAAGFRPMLVIPAGDAAESASVIVPAAPGQLVAGRRVPSKAEIAKINAALPPPNPDDAPIATAHGDDRP